MKKRILAMLMAAAAIMLTACGNSVEYTKGVSTDSGYESEFLGFRYEVPEGFIMASDEEIAAISGQSMEMLSDDMTEQQKQYAEMNVVYEMIAQNEAGTAQINVIVEKSVLGVNNYIKAAKSQISNLSAATVTIEDRVENVKIAGANYKKLSAVTESFGIEVEQEMYVRKIGERIVTITVSSYNDDEAREALMNGFTAY